ncbi:MAG: Myo-inositol(Or 4)-monophosphatase [Parcubacteria group bacterium]|nr:Myo-inositol(Or 4)-monophosphatase [Parcubacteria group bacterium]
MQEYLDIAKEIALEAGVIMTEYFGMDVEYTLKEDSQSASNQSPVTVADERIQQLVVARLEAAYPEHSLYGEEGKRMKESEFVWVFDPIDGTAAFVRGVPTNVFSLALVKKGTPVVGVVYDPHMKRLYHAVHGEGAFMNDLPIHTAARTELDGSYIETDGHKGFKNLNFFEQARQERVRLLSYSSTVYAHMMVAAGQLDGVVFPLSNPWDCAAAKVIVEEAGGVTSDLHGEPQRYDGDTKGFVSAATSEFHKKLLALIAPSV